MLNKHRWKLTPKKRIISKSNVIVHKQIMHLIVKNLTK